MRAAWVLALVMVAGCQETQHCAAGLYGRNCDQSLSMQPDTGVHDSGMDGAIEGDAGIDGGIDAFARDAGPCGDMCPVDRPLCFIAPPEVDSGMASGCVECVIRDDCTRVDGGMADAGIAGAQICQDFQCVFGCETDDDCGPTGACRPDGTCSAFPRAQDICRPCDTDANCTGLFRCVNFDNAGHRGSYCLADDTGVACSDRRRFTLPLNIVESVDGAPAANYCIPAAATCEAVLSANTDCMTSATCGRIGGIGTGICFAATYCTYTCDTLHGNNDCPSGMICDGASSACTR
jgi:hypothetical protein